MLKALKINVRNPTSTTVIALITTMLILVLLGLALTKPGFYIDRPGGEDAWSSPLFLFFFGWTAFMGGNFVCFFIWLANPAYIFGIIYMFGKNKKKAALLGLISVVLAVSFSQLDSIIASESGASSVITSLEPGYWLWLSSLIFFATGCITVYFIDKKALAAPA